MMNISINVCDLPHRYDTLKSIYSSIKLIIQRLISLLEQKNRNADEKFLILCLTLSRIPSFFGYSISKKKIYNNNNKQIPQRFMFIETDLV